MNEERKEVKRIGRKVIDGLSFICISILIVILIVLPFQILSMLVKPTKIIETLGIEDFISVSEKQVKINIEDMPDISELKGEYVCDYNLVRMKLVISDQEIEDVNLSLSLSGKIIVMIDMGIWAILFIFSIILPKDCHYVILWKKKENCFSVSFPEAYELQTPLEIKREFRMDVNKKVIKINDGNTILQLPYDKGAETLLWKIQKE